MMWVFPLLFFKTGAACPKRQYLACGAQCFCFSFGWPEPSEAASEGPLTERLKTHGPSLKAISEPTPTLL